MTLTTEEWASNNIWRYLGFVNLFWALNSDLHKLPYSNSVNVNNQKVQSVCRSSFDYLPQVYLWFWLWQYHLSSKQTVKCKCIALYDYTVHCAIKCFSITLTTEEWASNNIWRYLWIAILFWALNSDFHDMPFSSSVNENNQTV